jgi:aminomethyltransferase
MTGGSAPTSGAPIEADGAPVGEITSGCVSPAFGAIGLGFVRVPYDAPGTALRVGGRPAKAVVIPFAPTAEGDGG